MSLEVTEPATRDRLSSEDGIAAKQPDASILAAASAYVVILASRDDRLIRRCYLSLHSAEKALARAEQRGQPAWLVLCRLEPVSAELDGGEL
jgi:hypothetical protein